MVVLEVVEMALTRLAELLLPDKDITEDYQTIILWDVVIPLPVVAALALLVGLQVAGLEAQEGMAQIGLQTVLEIQKLKH